MEGLDQILQIDLSRKLLGFFFLDKSIQVEVVAYKSDKARDCRKGFDD